MTRVKKKVRSVAGQKFVPIKTPKKKPKDFDDPDSYESRKKRALARKKRQQSLAEREKQKAHAEAASDAPKRRSRLKRPPEEVAARSRALLDSAAQEAEEESENSEDS